MAFDFCHLKNVIFKFIVIVTCVLDDVLMHYDLMSIYFCAKICSNKHYKPF